MKSYYVYILASKKNGTLYTGITNNLYRRMYEHKNNITKGFTSRYQVHNLVYFEETNDVNEALAYEKRIKGWLRKKKIKLIETKNPGWDDLAKDWFANCYHSERSEESKNIWFFSVFLYKYDKLHLVFPVNRPFTLIYPLYYE